MEAEPDAPGRRGPGPSPPVEGKAEELRALFDRVVDLPREVRALCLEQELGADPGLRAEVEELLRSHDRMGDYLLEPFPAPILRGATPAATVDRPRAIDTGSGRIAPGDSVGGYVVESFLARGGGGEVYRARHRSGQGASVALKVLPQDEFGPGDQQRFRRGAEAARAIRHPHLVAVLEHGEDSARGVLYVAMPLVRGLSAAGLLESSVRASRRPDLAQRRLIVQRMSEACRGLAALHAAGWVHRDVKPANIVIESRTSDGGWRGRAVLVDIGLVRPLASDLTLSTLWATPSYAAPEYLLEGRADARSDVFSLGLCLFDLLSASDPEHRRGSSSASLDRLSVLVPDVSPELEAIVDRALEPDPRRRYPDATALADELEAWLAGKPVRVSRIRGLTRARRWLRRHPGHALTLLGRTGAVAAACVMAGGLFAWGWNVQQALAGARSAWSEGDLFVAQRALEEVPGWLAERWSGEAHDSLATSPLREVVAALEEGDTPRAALSAGQFLDRDGLEAQPDLVRWFTHLIADGNGADVTAALRVLAQLFDDRPDASATELRVSRPLRDTCLARMLDRTPDTRLYALAVLGGCGDAACVEPLVEALERTSERGDSGRPEELRLGLVALDRIMRRAPACGILEACAELSWPSYLRRTLAAVERVQPVPGAFDGLNLAVVSFLSAVAGVERRAGRLPTRVDTENTVGTTPAEVLAAWGDLDTLRTLRDPRAAERLLGPLHQDVLFRYGVALAQGGINDPGVAMQLALLIEERGGNPQNALLTLQVAASGVRRSWFELPRDSWPEKRLATALLEAGFERPAFERPGPDGVEGCSAWRFVGGSIRLTGGALDLEARAAPFEKEENLPLESFALLAVPGRSELRLTFDLARPLAHSLVLSIEAQKGLRSTLPRGGTPVVEVVLDERVVMGSMALPSWSVQTSHLPLGVPKEEQVGRHVLRIRLDAASDTSLRVRGVSIGLR